jgi:hypothetical protein
MNFTDISVQVTFEPGTDPTTVSSSMTLVSDQKMADMTSSLRASLLALNQRANVLQIISDTQIIKQIHFFRVFFSRPNFVHIHMNMLPNQEL